MTLTRTEVRDLLDRFDLRPKRSLGQNFVVEPNTVRRIAELSGVGPGDRVVEVGPGVGALTLALLETGAEVTAVEIDDRLVEVLGEVVGGRFDQLGAFRLVHADAMAVDWGELLGEGPWTLVANLPYNVSVPLVCDLLDEVPAITRMVAATGPVRVTSTLLPSGAPAFLPITKPAAVVTSATDISAGRPPAQGGWPSGARQSSRCSHES